MSVDEEPGGREEPRRYDLWAPRPPEGPVDLRTLVGGEGPLELDIGFGRGKSLLERLEAAPEARLIGVEIKAKWAYKVAERCRRAGLGRVAVLAADARELLARSGPDGCLARVFVHFPDPWWKKRHTKRRVVSGDLLDDLGRLLAPGGQLYVQTDVEERAEDYVSLLRAHPRFALATEDGRVDDNPFGARSNREARAAEDGLPVHRILAVRR